MNNLEDENVFSESCFSVIYESAFGSELLNIFKLWKFKIWIRDMCENGKPCKKNVLGFLLIMND